jgi:hypothetical protein
VHPHEVENALPEVGQHGDLHCMEEIELREEAHNAGNVSKDIKSSANMAR